MKLSSRLAAIGLAVFALSGPANAAYVFAVDTAGDASIAGAYPSFTLTSADDLPGFNTIATYTQLFSSAQTVDFSWNYTTVDRDGAAFDPAGYVLNGVLNKLSVDGEPGVGSAGFESVSVHAGDTFGWYIEAIDSKLGSGAMTINASAVPEPANLLLMLAGLGAIGVAWRRRPGR